MRPKPPDQPRLSDKGGPDATYSDQEILEAVLVSSANLKAAAARLGCAPSTVERRWDRPSMQALRAAHHQHHREVTLASLSPALPLLAARMVAIATDDLVKPRDQIAAINSAFTIVEKLSADAPAPQAEIDVAELRERMLGIAQNAGPLSPCARCSSERCTCVPI